MQPEEPVPVSGHFDLPTTTLVMVFDRPLLAGPLDAANWVVHFASTKYNGLVATAGTPTATDVTVNMVAGFPPPAPGARAYYNPPPFDVKSLTGIPAALFAGFPLT